MKRLLINILPIKSVLGPPPHSFLFQGTKNGISYTEILSPGLLVSQKIVRSHERRRATQGSRVNSERKHCSSAKDKRLMTHRSGE